MHARLIARESDVHLQQCGSAVPWWSEALFAKKRRKVRDAKLIERATACCSFLTERKAPRIYGSLCHLLESFRDE